MDSWLGDTDKNFGPDLLLLFKARNMQNIMCKKLQLLRDEVSQTNYLVPGPHGGLPILQLD